MAAGSSLESGARGPLHPLVALARAAVEHGVLRGALLSVDLSAHPEPFRSPGASFVTLRRSGALRGCVGSLAPRRPLVADVAHNAFAAALEDRRFAPLVAAELEALDVHVSVLGPLEPLPVGSEAELLARLRPGVDGLVLRQGRRQATFLPAVWETLSEPHAFVHELRRKAGLPLQGWPDDLEVLRYRVESLG